MELSHTVGIFLWVAIGVVSKYFLFLCLLNALFQIMQVSNASGKSLISVWLKVVIAKISCDNLSGEEMYSIHWICPLYVLSLETCIHVHQWLATNNFNYGDGFTHRFWWISVYFFIGLKVVVYLPSKDIVRNDVSSCIFLSWIMILRHESVDIFRQPGISSIALISPHASRTGVCVYGCLCVFAYAYECVYHPSCHRELISLLFIKILRVPTISHSLNISTV
jgi:hypothetical protein